MGICLGQHRKAVYVWVFVGCLPFSSSAHTKYKTKTATTTYFSYDNNNAHNNFAFLFNARMHLLMPFLFSNTRKLILHFYQPTPTSSVSSLCCISNCDCNVLSISLDLAVSIIFQLSLLNLIEFTFQLNSHPCKCTLHTVFTEYLFSFPVSLSNLFATNLANR